MLNYLSYLSYLLVLVLGIPTGFLLSKICKEEIKAWIKRLKIIIVVCLIMSFALFFVNFGYKIPVIITLGFTITTCWTIVWKSYKK